MAFGSSGACNAKTMRFSLCDDERGSAFEGNTLLELRNETERDPRRGQRLIDVVAYACVILGTQVDDEECW